jgi:coatomer subunit gamma
VPELILENVFVAVKVDSVGTFKLVGEIKIDKLGYDDVQSSFLAYEIDPSEYPEASLLCKLKFSSRSCDPSTGEVMDDVMDDEYHLESCDIGFGDFICNREIIDVNADWTNLGPNNERSETFALTAFSTIQEAVDALSSVFCIRLTSGAAKVDPHAVVHSVVYAGILRSKTPDGDKFNARCRLAMSSTQSGVTLQMSVRSTSAKCSEAIINVIN